MGFRPWGIVWAVRASLLIEYQPLMGLWLSGCSEVGPSSPDM